MAKTIKEHKCNTTLVMNRPDNSFFYRSPQHVYSNKILGLFEKISLGRAYLSCLTNRVIPLENRKIEFITDFRNDSFLSQNMHTLTIIGHGANHQAYKHAMEKLSDPKQLSSDEREELNDEISQYVSFYSPQILADMLHTSGLRSVKYLKLIGCYMGNSSNPYIELLATALTTKGINFSEISATMNCVAAISPIWIFSLGSATLKWRVTNNPNNQP
ncbi:hypothetical protein [Endozoicomonas sp.]|uniref:hypothetical protein n=1 Tax=Endozoicomonas sp. TaxID=1892382 RepID=UPI0028880ADA|nr:hypothetical protein [Endozoicomonas sp.]